MMKRKMGVCLAAFLCVATIGTTALASGAGERMSIQVDLASKQSAEVHVMMPDGPVLFDQPPVIVSGRTLVPIRAVCERLGATVGWEADTQRISITQNETTLFLHIGDPIMRISDGTEVTLAVPPQVYGDRTLLPIRDVVEQLGCKVQWVEESRLILIARPHSEYLTSTSDTGLDDTQQIWGANWANVSSMQQFSYKNEGLAYAYLNDGALDVTTPSKQLSLPMHAPLLGDVIADENGNFYVISGKIGTSEQEQTVFISKYSSEGRLVKTTGFVGESPMGQSGNTKIPFEAGNCSVAIGNGRLMVNYAREMYTGHQSNNVIGVHLSDMSAVQPETMFEIPYTSHSFNQGVIWSQQVGDFVYADHGDAYGRGFMITTGTTSNLVFHFYLGANTNYDMYVVNKTFAQFGNIAETSKGVVLVGASAKSISEVAKTEKQNLFIQIMDPATEEISSSMFQNGAPRKGATSLDINDTQNTPLTSVTDYGVQWLTNYTDTDVIAPQVMVVEDQIVILWSTELDSYYMILAADGKIVMPATSLNGLPLNSYERPIYHNGTLTWVAVTYGQLIRVDIEI